MLLDLAFTARDQQTVIAHEQVSAPLAFRATAPFGPVSAMLTGAIHGKVLTLGGGLLAGQKVEMRLRVGGGARASIGTVGATVVHGAEGGAMTQQCHRFDVATGGVLAYLPDETIPCRGARFEQQTQITLEREASLLYSEVLTPGRLWHGERFAYHGVALGVTVTDGTRPLLIDRSIFQPAEGSLQAPGRLACYTHVGTLIVFGPGAGAELAATLHEVLQLSGVAASASHLYAGGILVRALGHSAHALKVMINEAVAISLQALATAQAQGS